MTEDLPELIIQKCVFPTKEVGILVVEKTKKYAHKIAEDLGWDAYEVHEHYSVHYTNSFVEAPIRSKSENNIEDALSDAPYHMGEFNIGLYKLPRK